MQNMKTMLAIALFALSSTPALADLNGIYSVRQETPGKVFRDILILEEAAPDTAAPGGRTIGLQGSLTVPGVFTVPLAGAQASYQPNIPDELRRYLSFDILAAENGQTFKVHYNGRILGGQTLSDPVTIEGRATLDGGAALGRFTATRLR